MNVEREMALRDARKTADRVSKELERRMAKPGALGLPELLEQRRLYYGLPDGFFKQQAAFDRVLVYQLPRFEGETYGDTSIVMPETVKDKLQKSTPRGVIVSAGLRALDTLRSNGMDLGHVVSFVHLAPWRIETDMIAGVTFYLMVMYSGDIVASEDTARLLSIGQLSIKQNVNNGLMEHVVADEKGTEVRPYVTDNSAEGY